MPYLMVVSVRPSVSLHPSEHLLRSIEKPSGPESVLPSADLPQPLSSICFTTASRCFFHNASHSAMDVGAGAEVELAPAVVDVTAVDDVTVVVGAAESPSSPHVGNNTAMPN